MSQLPMPRPWSERAPQEAQLLAPSKVSDGKPQTPPPMPSVGRALTGLVTRLGARDAHCDKHGRYRSSGTRINATHPVETWTTCPGCALDAADVLRRDRDAGDALVRRERLEQAMSRSALPERFVGRSFDNYDAETPKQQIALNAMRAFVDEFEAHMSKGTTLVLSGGVGTGKSHLASAAMQALMDRHFSLYVTAMGLIRMVRDTWRRDSARSESQVMTDLARVDLLVIDEVGVQYGTDGEKLVLFEVLDRRYMDRKPTVLLTNLVRTEFREFVGDRVFDRMREVGQWIRFDWDSYRAIARNND